MSNTELAILAEYEIDKPTYSALKDSLFPGASDQSVAMILAYCKARKIDPMLKPVHLVPMFVKTGKKDAKGYDEKEWRDVVMPGIGLYRIDASRSGQYAGMTEPQFGEDITEQLGNKKIIYPKWCKITVNKIVNNNIVTFTALEYWKENYATAKKDTDEPNSMWFKRPYGQLAKCAEAQALRKAFPDVVGQEVTGEEMEGKTFEPIKTLKTAIEGEVVKSITFLEDQVFCQNAISACANIDDLKTVFNKISREYRPILGDIIRYKDEKKAELDKQSTDEFLKGLEEPTQEEVA